MPKFPATWRDLDVVLCHDWLTGMRGGEKVLEILCDAFPNAPVYTLIHEREKISAAIRSHPIHTSFLQRIPGIHKRYRHLLPLFPLAIRSLKLPSADLVISTSHCVAKSVIPRGGAKHLCYCFTPMRYAWALQDEYFHGRPVASALATPVLRAIRQWDRRTASRVDRFIGISQHIQNRIQSAYGRSSDLVYPPVDTERFEPVTQPENAPCFDLVVSALVPYKRVDLAVMAYNRTGMPLKVVGTGTEYDRLAAVAGPNIEFLGWGSDDKIRQLYQSCRFLVFPGEEDFGIVPVEAQACGKPIIAYGKGGALETVVAGQTGVFFSDHSPEGLVEALERAEAIEWTAEGIARHAGAFGEQTFIDGMATSVDALLSDREPE